MPPQEKAPEKRNRRKREDADVEAHGQRIEELDENEAGRRRRRRLTETPDETEAGRRRR